MSIVDTLQADAAALDAKIDEFIALFGTVSQQLADAIAAGGANVATLQAIDAQLQADVAKITAAEPQPPAVP